MCSWLFKYLSIVNLSLFTLAGISLGLLATVITGMILVPTRMPAAATSMAPSTPQPRLSLNDCSVIVERNIFNHEARTAMASLDQANPSDAITAGGEYTLLGTVIAEPKSLALIRLDDGNGVFHLGAQLPGGSTIVDIKRNQVTLKNPDGTQQHLTVENPPPDALPAHDDPPSAGIQEIGKNRWRVSRIEVEKARSDLNSLLKSARMEPKIENGRTEGFIVKMIRSKSLLDRMGVKRNDLVREVNGVTLDSPEKALQVFQQLREAKRIVIGLERSNKPMNLEYTIE